MPKSDASDAVPNQPADRRSTPLSPDALLTLLNLCSDGVALVEPVDGRIAFANSNLQKWLSMSDSRPAEATIFQWLPDAASPTARRELARVAANEIDEATFTTRMVGASAEDRQVQVRVRRVESGKDILLAVFLRPVSLDAETPSTSRAGVDPLTGLADRAFLLDRLNTIIHGDRVSDQGCAVLFVDVDGFKQVNDSFGHLIGDRVLCEVARRLAASVRAQDLVARFGGDEFVVLLERVSGRDDFEPVTQRIEAAFKQPIAMPQGEVTLAVSVGAAHSGVDGTSAEELIDAADRAMYAAKRTTA